VTTSSRHPQRRADLIAATRRVAAERGLAATNVRAVAAEAAISPGSVLYYFPTFEELIFASVEGVMEEFHGARQAIAERVADPIERMRQLIAAGIPDVITEDLRVVYESIALVRAKPQYRPLMRSIVERQVTMYRSTIELGAALGVFTLADEPAAIARNIVALEDAYDLYPLIGVSLDREAVRRAVMRYAELALGAEILAPAADSATA